MLITAYEQLLSNAAISTELGKALETIDLQKLIDEGMEVNEVDTTAFIDASKPIYDEFSQSVDGAAELIKKAQDLAAQ